MQSLKNILSYAYNEVDYYRNLFDENNIDVNSINSEEDFLKIPFLTKETVQREINNILSNEYKKYPKNSNIDVRRTSGSTGEYLKVCWDNKDNIKSLLPLWRIRKIWYSITPDMKFCSFYAVRYVGNKIVSQEDKELNFNGRNLSFSKVGLTYERLRKCYEDILEFNPDWFNFQPSIAYLLSQLVKEYKLPVPTNLKYIELNGEMLTDECRKSIKEAFNIEPVNMYGMNETNTIAIDCEDKKLHILEDNVIVEVIKDGIPVIGEEGDIYVTSLTNYAMPFIRYNTGDRGILLNEQCSCGRNSQIIELSSGRASDFIALQNGEKISSYILVGIIQYTNEYMSNAIKQFQVIQTSINSFEVILAVKPAYKGWENSIQKAFINNISEPELKDAKWNFTFVDDIYPDAHTGKLKYFKALK